MKAFDPITFDAQLCRTQLDDFRALLAGKNAMGERADILPFFQTRRQLAVLMGMFNPLIGQADRYAHEFDLFGDFACDLLIGQGVKGEYCLIEFEDAKPDSVFRRQGKKATREWSPRFEHGFGQIVDWCCKLDGLAYSQDMLSRFGRPKIGWETVLVIGRDHDLDAGERLRLDWRSGHVVVNSKKVFCLTYDGLLNQLTNRLTTFGVGLQPPEPADPLPPPNE